MSGTTSTLFGGGLSPIVNVLERGAVGNGVADDTLPIQTALNSVQTTGGSVYVPAGSYRLTNALRVYSGTRIYGDGASSVLSVDPAGWLLGTTDVYGILTIKGNSDVEVSSLKLRGVKGQLISRTPKLIYLENAERINIHDNQLEYSEFEGIWQGGAIANVRDLIISNNIIRDVGWPAGAFGGLPAIQVNATGALIVNNTLIDVGCGIGLSGTRSCALNNRITGVTLVGISTGDGGLQEDMLISNNAIRIYANSTRTVAGIIIQNSAGQVDSVRVNGNHISIVGTPGYFVAFGIRIYNGSSASVVGNHISIKNEGIGINLLGFATGAKVMLSGNSIYLNEETGASYGISGRPDGAGKSLTVVSSGNYVTGMSSLSFPFDFTQASGGDLSVHMRNDFASSGRVRIGAYDHTLSDSNGEYVDWPQLAVP